MHCKLSVWEFCSQVVLAELFTVRGELWCIVRWHSEVERGGWSDHGSSLPCNEIRKKCFSEESYKENSASNHSEANTEKLILCHVTLLIHPTPSVRIVLGHKLYFKYCKTVKIISCVKRSRSWRLINAPCTISREPETISEFILSCDHCISTLAICKVHSSAADEWRKTVVRVQLSLYYFGHHLQFSHNMCT